VYNIFKESEVPMKLDRFIKMCLNETCSKVRTGKLFLITFSIWNGLKQGDALSPLLFKFASEYAIGKGEENFVGEKLNGTHQLLVYADVNLLEHIYIYTAKKDTQTLTQK
jgi:hypothetical protein